MEYIFRLKYRKTQEEEDNELPAPAPSWKDPPPPPPIPLPSNYEVNVLWGRVPPPEAPLAGERRKQPRASELNGSSRSVQPVSWVTIARRQRRRWELAPGDKALYKHQSFIPFAERKKTLIIVGNSYQIGDKATRFSDQWLF